MIPLPELSFESANSKESMELFFTTQVNGKVAILSGEEAAHCVRVMRHKVGDTIFVTDGAGNLYRCTVREIPSAVKGGKVSKKQKIADIVECEILENSVGVGGRSYHLTMAVCPTKNIDRYEWFLEKATEFGIDALYPIISDHSIRTTVKKERLEAIALSATKQSLKSYLPEIKETVSVLDFIAEFAESEDTLKLIAYCEPGDKKSIRARLSESKILREGSCPKVAIMIGPEGDFSDREIEAAQNAGFKPVTLGESRLRVETAAIAGVSEIYFSCCQGFSSIAVMEPNQ